jgi:hypothetical protein
MELKISARKTATAWSRFYETSSVETLFVKLKFINFILLLLRAMYEIVSISDFMKSFLPNFTCKALKILHLRLKLILLLLRARY